MNQQKGNKIKLTPGGRLPKETVGGKKAKDKTLMKGGTTVEIPTLLVHHLTLRELTLGEQVEREPLGRESAKEGTLRDQNPLHTQRIYAPDLSRDTKTS